LLERGCRPVSTLTGRSYFAEYARAIYLRNQREGTIVASGIESSQASLLQRLGHVPWTLVAAVLAVVAVAIMLPAFDLVKEAPEVVSEADIAALEATPATPGSSESGHSAVRWGGRGMSTCTRDHAIYGFAQQIHIPASVLLRIEYSMITDCRLRIG
jgi:hypothetical protein